MNTEEKFCQLIASLVSDEEGSISDNQVARFLELRDYFSEAELVLAQQKAREVEKDDQGDSSTWEFFMGPATVKIDLSALKFYPRNIQTVQGQPVHFKNSNPESTASIVSLSVVYLGAGMEAETVACSRRHSESSHDPEWILEKLPPGTECATWVPNQIGFYQFKSAVFPFMPGSVKVAMEDGSMPEPSPSSHRIRSLAVAETTRVCTHQDKMLFEAPSAYEPTCPSLTHNKLPEAPLQTQDQATNTIAGSYLHTTVEGHSPSQSSAMAMNSPLGMLMNDDIEEGDVQQSPHGCLSGSQLLPPRPHTSALGSSSSSSTGLEPGFPVSLSTAPSASLTRARTAPGSAASCSSSRSSKSGYGSLLSSNQVGRSSPSAFAARTAALAVAAARVNASVGPPRAPPVCPEFFASDSGSLPLDEECSSEEADEVPSISEDAFTERMWQAAANSEYEDGGSTELGGEEEQDEVDSLAGVQYTLLPGGEDEDEVEDSEDVDILTRGISEGTNALNVSREFAEGRSSEQSRSLSPMELSTSVKATHGVKPASSAVPYTTMVEEQRGDHISEEVELQDLYVRPIHITSTLQQDEEGSLSLRPRSWQRPATASPSKLSNGEIALPGWEDESGVRAKTSPVKTSKNVFVRTSESPDGTPPLWTALGTKLEDSVLVPGEGFRVNQENQPDPTALGYRFEGDQEGLQDKATPPPEHHCPVCNHKFSTNFNQIRCSARHPLVEVREAEVMSAAAAAAGERKSAAQTLTRGAIQKAQAFRKEEAKKKAALETMLSIYWSSLPWRKKALILSLADNKESCKEKILKRLDESTQRTVQRLQWPTAHYVDSGRKLMVWVQKGKQQYIHHSSPNSSKLSSTSASTSSDPLEWSWPDWSSLYTLLRNASEELVCSTRGFKLDANEGNQRAAVQDCEASIAWLIEQTLCENFEKDREETAAKALSELQAEAEEDSRLRAEKKKEKAMKVKKGSQAAKRRGGSKGGSSSNGGGHDIKEEEVEEEGLPSGGLVISSSVSNVESTPQHFTAAESEHLPSRELAMITSSVTEMVKQGSHTTSHTTSLQFNKITPQSAIISHNTSASSIVSSTMAAGSKDRLKGSTDTSQVLHAKNRSQDTIQGSGIISKSKSTLPLHAGIGSSSASPVGASHMLPSLQPPTSSQEQRSSSTKPSGATARSRNITPDRNMMSNSNSTIHITKTPAATAPASSKPSAAPVRAAGHQTAAATGMSQTATTSGLPPVPAAALRPESVHSGKKIRRASATGSLPPAAAQPAVPTAAQPAAVVLPANTPAAAVPPAAPAAVLPAVSGQGHVSKDQAAPLSSPAVTTSAADHLVVPLSGSTTPASSDKLLSGPHSSQQLNNGMLENGTPQSDLATTNHGVLMANGMDHIINAPSIVLGSSQEASRQTATESMMGKEISLNMASSLRSPTEPSGQDDEAVPGHQGGHYDHGPAVSQLPHQQVPLEAAAHGTSLAPSAPPPALPAVPLQTVPPPALLPLPVYPPVYMHPANSMHQHHLQGQLPAQQRLFNLPPAPPPPSNPYGMPVLSSDGRTWLQPALPSSAPRFSQPPLPPQIQYAAVAMYSQAQHPPGVFMPPADGSSSMVAPHPHLYPGAFMQPIQHYQHAPFQHPPSMTPYFLPGQPFTVKHAGAAGYPHYPPHYHDVQAAPLPPQGSYHNYAGPQIPNPPPSMQHTMPVNTEPTPLLLAMPPAASSAVKMIDPSGPPLDDLPPHPNQQRSSLPQAGLPQHDTNMSKTGPPQHDTNMSKAGPQHDITISSNNVTTVIPDCTHHIIIMPEAASSGTRWVDPSCESDVAVPRHQTSTSQRSVAYPAVHHKHADDEPAMHPPRQQQQALQIAAQHSLHKYPHVVVLTDKAGASTEVTTTAASSEPTSPIIMPGRQQSNVAESEGRDEVATPSGDAAVVRYSRGSRRVSLDAGAIDERMGAGKVTAVNSRPAAAAAETLDQAKQRKSNFSQLLSQAFSTSGKVGDTTGELKEGIRQAPGGLTAAAAVMVTAIPAAAKGAAAAASAGIKKAKEGTGGFDAAAAQAELGSRWQEVEAALLAGEVEVIGRHSAG
ncbi:hypothetical protein CEUSTIGMA_g7093.t1 [Chlamydomonas eustigma]|uniref:Uncharacterized protein n=1 Tax=Chlamydomonas eustigma TaxID=1157962 RepID=A0A250X9W8_9CHLO|nr:hypothetical protein CEUSTIGMA_g7093.t1 [Chlamydomonas eustigma]|eukprot:GAX79652.1 hypothetical protein CEUSTIGMA_g7093.t1 [Chlamydomonas eustigma]